MEKKISIHPLTHNPTAAWEQISETQEVIKLDIETPQEPPEEGKLRFVCMSDTHSSQKDIRFAIPDGDVFIHAGDFTKFGEANEVIAFNNWIRTLPHKYKIVVAGNHELSFDEQFAHIYKTTLLRAFQNLVKNPASLTKTTNIKNVRQLLTSCTYLEDSGVDIYGIKIYGSPWQPKYRDGAFNLQRGAECLSKWNLIPDNTDILITHTPPVGHGDLVESGVRAGCVELLSTVQKRVKPKYHIFGHIHEGYGVSTDGKIIFINASTYDINHMPANSPIVFDVPLPPGKKKVK